MKRLFREQKLPINLEQAWSFFSNPYNLNKITPDDMNFRILNDIPELMYEGMIISYKIKPMLNVEMDWVTEITKIKEKEYFIDEQRLGPYKIWHHEHHFKEVEDGVLMTDILHYHIGKSIFGRLAGILFVDNKVKNIFDYRYLVLQKIFN